VNKCETITCDVSSVSSWSSSSSITSRGAALPPCMRWGVAIEVVWGEVGVWGAVESLPLVCTERFTLFLWRTFGSDLRRHMFRRS